jgi:amino acid transporter
MGIKALDLPPYGAGSDHEKASATAPLGPAESVSLSSDGGVNRNVHRKLKSRHIQLIGIGGTIGTALYVCWAFSLHPTTG